MSTYHEKKLNTILQGEIVAILNNPTSTNTARIYATKESRGYQTDYKHKTFFYLVIYKEGQPVRYTGLTNDPRRKTMVKYWQENRICCKIFNQRLFDELVQR